MSEYLAPWADYDRGLVGNDGIAIRTCSTEYLSALHEAYKAVLGGPREGATSHNAPASIRQELYRLHLHPTLYPTLEVQCRFRGLLEDGVDKWVEPKDKVVLDSVDINDSIIEQANIEARRLDRFLQANNRPTFKPDLLPWEQFLLKGSPGSGIRLPDAPPNCVSRIMPIGGVALHLRWLRTRYLVGKRCREASIPNIRDLQRCAAATAQGPTIPRELPSTGLSHRQQWVELTPNPFYEKYTRITRDTNASERLENLSLVIDIMEEDNVANHNEDPEATVAVIYRSWSENLQIEESED